MVYKGCTGSSGRLTPSQVDGKGLVSEELDLSGLGRLISGLLEDSNKYFVLVRLGTANAQEQKH